MFESLKSKFQFQLKLKDRVNAANILAAALSDRLSKQERQNACILGIPRGGVIIADIVASKLQTANFNIIIPRKLTIPNNEEIAFGAVMFDGMTYLNHSIEVPPKYIEIEKLKQIQEIKRRLHLYLATDNTNYFGSVMIDDSIVILVDDGVASGATFAVAAMWIRKFYTPKMIVAAATVAPKETVEFLKNEVEQVEVITQPSSSNFNYVGQYYQEFPQVTDEQVIQVMKARKLLN